MAVLGFHSVLSLISASILQRLSAHYSLGRRLISRGLVRYLHPSTEALREAAGMERAKSGGKAAKGGATRRRGGEEERDRDHSFLLPKSAPIELEKAEVTAVDVLQLPLYVELRWVVDLSVAALVVFLITETYAWLLPRRSGSELNLSAVWWVMVLFSSLKALAALSSHYFRSGEAESAAVERGGESSLLLCFGLLTFLASMVMMMVGDEAFDVGLLRAYRNLTAGTDAYLASEDVDFVSGTRSPILLYLVLSAFFGCLGGLLTFPAFRLARMYSDAVGYAGENGLTQLALHVSFFAPLPLLGLWLKEVGPWLRLSAAQLESVRMWSLAGLLLLRLATTRLHLQAYLNSAHANLMKLRTEAGRINSLALQRSIAQIFAFLCAAALQFLVPLAMLTALLCLRKSCGAYKWLPSSQDVSPFPALSPFDVPPKAPTPGSVQAQLASITVLFNPIVHRGLWNLLLLNTLLIHSTLSVLGFLYNRRIHNQ